MSKGWIKLHRQILDSAIWNIDAPHNERDAWIEFLLMANHADKQIITRRHECIQIKRGQFFTSVRKLADRFGWSMNRVRRYMDTLADTHMVTVDGYADGTLVTVENYAKFQDSPHTDGYADGYADAHAGGYTDGTRTRIYKNDKEDKREGQAPRAFVPPSVDEVKAYCLDNNYKIDAPLFMAYYEARDWTLSKGKPMSNWKSAVTAWARREKNDSGSRPTDGMNDRQAQLQYARTKAQLEEYAREGTAPKFKGGLAAEMLRRKSG